ncbi:MULTISPECIES: DUF2380 domain-containing protein [Methylomonas]|uniref:DUF2380 domain-containing protein n=1 Tax=Methylomonas TaxID=416 RepID=UPI001232D7CB|nr:DUF2380 domain-containing protein [Methylomonas rhizoryzae]
MKAFIGAKIAAIIIAFHAVVGYAGAEPRIAVLNFELRDYSALPYREAERTRVSAIRPMLERRLVEEGIARSTVVPIEEWNAANPSVGYLFAHNDAAADFGRKLQTDWLVVGQLSKLSDMVSYLLVHVVDVHNRRLSADYALELKGSHAGVLQQGIKRIGSQITRVVAE